MVCMRVLLACAVACMCLACACVHACVLLVRVFRQKKGEQEGLEEVEDDWLLGRL